jgi:hypothetical protein
VLQSDCAPFKSILVELSLPRFPMNAVGQFRKYVNNKHLKNVRENVKRSAENVCVPMSKSLHFFFVMSRDDNVSRRGKGRLVACF